MGRDYQWLIVHYVEVFGDGGVEALGDLGPRSPVAVVDALDVLASELAVVTTS